MLVNLISVTLCGAILLANYAHYVSFGMNLLSAIGMVISSSYIYLDAKEREEDEALLILNQMLGLVLKGSDGILMPKLIDIVEDRYQTIFKYRLPIGMSIKDFEKNLPKINQAFKGDFKIVQNPDFTISLINYKENVYDKYEPVQLKPYEILIGNQFGKPLVVNMNKYPHMLLGGNTGTGKSRVLFTILSNLIATSRENIDLYLLQVRKSDLSVFKNCKQVKAHSKSLEDVLDSLNKVEKILNQRENLIDPSKGINNIEDYNRKHKKDKLNYIYVIIDEFSFINIDKCDTKQTKLIKNAILKHLKSIVNAGRSSGVFLITSLQKPTADSIPSNIKSMLCTRVSLYIPDNPVSQVILDTTEATQLKERELIVKTKGTEYGTSLTIDYNAIMEYIKPYLIEERKENLLPQAQPQTIIKKEEKTETNTKTKVAATKKTTPERINIDLNKKVVDISKASKTKSIKTEKKEDTVNSKVKLL